MSERKILLTLLLVGFSMRLVAFFLLPPQDFDDAAAYVAMGREFLDKGFATDTHFMPLYPLTTALMGGATGAMLFDVLVSTGFIALIFHLACALGIDRRAALLAAAVTAVYPHFIFYSVTGLTETTYMALLAGAFLCLYREREAWGSVLLVLSILERPSLDLLAPALVVLFALAVHRRPWRRALSDLMKYAVIYVVLMAPWWLYNYAQYGQFVRLNLGDGIVLYSGNNPLNVSGGGVAYGLPNDDMDLTPFSTIADPVARNDAMKAAAYRFIRENPGHFAEMMGVKFVRFWRLWPYSPRYQTWPIIVLSLLSYGIVLPLAVLAVARSERSALMRLSPILALAAYLSLLHMVTIGSIRYRLPLEPFMIVLAAGLWKASRQTKGTACAA